MVAKSAQTRQLVLSDLDDWPSPGLGHALSTSLKPKGRLHAVQVFFDSDLRCSPKTCPQDIEAWHAACPTMNARNAYREQGMQHPCGKDDDVNFFSDRPRPGRMSCFGGVPFRIWWKPIVVPSLVDAIVDVHFTSVAQQQKAEMWNPCMWHVPRANYTPAFLVP